MARVPTGGGSGDGGGGGDEGGGGTGGITQAQLDAAVAAIIAGAPTSGDTLAEVFTAALGAQASANTATQNASAAVSLAGSASSALTAANAAAASARSEAIVAQDQVFNHVNDQTAAHAAAAISFQSYVMDGDNVKQALEYASNRIVTASNNADTALGTANGLQYGLEALAKLTPVVKKFHYSVAQNGGGIGAHSLSGLHGAQAFFPTNGFLIVSAKMRLRAAFVGTADTIINMGWSGLADGLLQAISPVNDPQFIANNAVNGIAPLQETDAIVPQYANATIEVSGAPLTAGEFDLYILGFQLDADA